VSENHKPSLRGKPKPLRRARFHLVNPKPKENLEVGNAGFNCKQDPFSQGNLSRAAKETSRSNNFNLPRFFGR